MNLIPIVLSLTGVALLSGIKAPPRSSPQIAPAALVVTTADPERVEPGLVRWHGDFAAARAAATRSGKPVLLFQLLGRLDEEFC
ncbi:MAG: hypothetical protein IPK26_23000 [Planctomycetes bacterium]|nr:hypothetical protein [Planctomycetota bacterium]